MSIYASESSGAGFSNCFPANRNSLAKLTPHTTKPAQTEGRVSGRSTR